MRLAAEMPGLDRRVFVNETLRLFDRLRRDCPCGGCAALEALAPEMAWPEAIKKADAELRVTWADRHASAYPYPELRALCRCAGCTGGH